MRCKTAVCAAMAESSGPRSWVGGGGEREGGKGGRGERETGARSAPGGIALSPSMRNPQADPACSTASSPARGGGEERRGTRGTRSRVAGRGRGGETRNARGRSRGGGSAGGVRRAAGTPVSRMTACCAGAIGSARGAGPAGGAGSPARAIARVRPVIRSSAWSRSFRGRPWRGERLQGGVDAHRIDMSFSGFQLYRHVGALHECKGADRVVGAVGFEVDRHFDRVLAVKLDLDGLLLHHGRHIFVAVLLVEIGVQVEQRRFAGWDRGSVAGLWDYDRYCAEAAQKRP